MGLIDAYKRWRHSKGYGVHSPYAFELVTQVVRPGSAYGYYAYSDIENASSDSLTRAERVRARTLIRLAAFLDVRSAFIPHDHTGSPFIAALKAARSDMKVCSALAEADKCSLICTIGDFIPLERLVALLRAQDRTLAIENCPESWREKLFDALTEGVMFYGRRDVLIITRPYMQKVAYSMKFV